MQDKLLPDDLPTIEYAYNVVGKYLYPTLEQWEVTFMQAADWRGQIAMWGCLSIVFERWCRDSAKTITEDEKRQFVNELAGLARALRLTAKEIDREMRDQH